MKRWIHGKEDDVLPLKLLRLDLKLHSATKKIK